MTTIDLIRGGRGIAVTGNGVAPAATSCDDRPRRDRPTISPFERLIQISQSNDRLRADLAKTRRRLAQAVAYATDPRSCGDLGVALIALARKQQSRVLRQLRVNRFEALALLAARSG